MLSHRAGSVAVPLWIPLALLFAVGTWTAVFCEAAACELRVLLIGSHAAGPADWVTMESLLIENMLEFNGIPYEFFDVLADSLDQSKLDCFDGVIVEGWALHRDASANERAIIAQNMRDGNITALIGVIRGAYTDLNSTVYDAINVSVDGLGNGESNIHLHAGASNVYDYEGEGGFIICGGYCSKHVGIAVTALGEWTYVAPCLCAERVSGLEFALARWMKNAFGVDARVTMPVISFYLSDTQTTAYPRQQEVIDFLAANKHRIRASGFLLTDASAYQTTDTTLQNDEQIISELGSMVLHGKDHGTVGAEGENRDFDTQYADMSAAVAFLEQHFARYKAIKGPPNLSWNEATLHAMYLNGIYFHAASIRKGPEYKALYKSVLDAADELEREKIFARGNWAGLRYYPLVHSDATGEARIYSVDVYTNLGGCMDPAAVLPTLKQYAIDWWTPVMVSTHFSSPDSGGPLHNPTGWIAMMDTLMNVVDHDSYQWRRWLDAYDYAESIQRFDQDLTVNAISIMGNTVTYDITAGQPTRFVTLKADSPGLKVHSVTVNGADYCYFGDNYVHLPELDGTAAIVVNLTSQDDYHPHVTHITPNAVIENAAYVDGRLDLALTGEFVAVVRVTGSSKVFEFGTTRVSADSTEQLDVDVSSYTDCPQVELSLLPASGSVTAALVDWDPLEPGCRQWVEHADTSGLLVDHIVGHLLPDTCYVVLADSCPIDTCISNGSGEVRFTCPQGTCECRMEILMESLAGMPQPNPPLCSSVFVSNHPNPFGLGTTITYGLPFRSYTTLKIYSVNGTFVRQLVAGIRPAGIHSATWDGLDTSGKEVAPGVYFCRIETEQGVATRKVISLRQL